MKWAFLALLMFPIQFHPAMPCSSQSIPVYIPAQFPRELKVEGKKWKLVGVRSLPFECVGWTIDNQKALDDLPPEDRKNHKIGEILLLNNLRDSDKSWIVLHELQHVILGTENSQQTFTLHDFITVSAQRWAHVLRDNPELVRFVSEH